MLIWGIWVKWGVGGLLLSVVQCCVGLKHLSGDFLLDPGVKGPDGKPYPKHQVNRAINDLLRERRGRSFFRAEDPVEVRQKLMEGYRWHRSGDRSLYSRGRGILESKSVIPSLNASQKDEQPPSAACASSIPDKLCPSEFNTTAPMYGVSLTSGKPVTIVQKFPDLLQQVIFEVCKSKECDIVHGECVQTYVPYLFLVIPLGPVTLTGQDYVLVESGCVCQPKYAAKKDPSAPVNYFGES